MSKMSCNCLAEEFKQAHTPTCPQSYQAKAQRYHMMSRQIGNSPPPLGDVGDEVGYMMDGGMGMLKGDEYSRAVGDFLNSDEPEYRYEYDEDLNPNPHVVAANHGATWSYPPTPEEYMATLSAMNQRVGATKDLLDERRKTHGSFHSNAAYGQHLREFFRASYGWELATDRQREALEYIAGKLARILSGQPGYADHWVDISGYAELACNPER
jgi:hypothetical protein